VTPDLPQVERAIIEFTNQFRRQSDLGELRRNRTLDQAARAFAQYLARTGKFSHTADGRRPADRTLAVGYRHCRVSENLALNIDSRGFRARTLATGAVEGWKKSPPHRKAMLDPHVIEIGVGVARAADEHRYLSVQLFGRPRELQYRFTIRNTSQRRIRYAHGSERHVLSARTEVQHTACNPAILSLEGVRQAKTAKSPSKAAFQTRDGDTFVIRMRAGGELIVEHRPRVD
jgi:hypothetical protein